MVHTVNEKLVFVIAFVLLSVLTAFFVANMQPTVTLAITGAVVVFFVAFASTEAALYVLIFSMLLSPEFGARGTSGSGATVRLDDFLLLVIGWSWLVRMAVHKELGLFLKTDLNKPILYYVLACFFSTALGMMAGRVSILTGFLFVFKYIEYFLVYFMVAHYIKDVKQVRNFLIAMFVTCLIVCIVAVAQIPSGERVTAPFEGKGGEPNTLGGYLVFMLAVAMGLIFHLKNDKRRLQLVVLCGCILVPLLFTLSRSSWMAFIPMYLVYMKVTDYGMPLLAVLLIGLVLGPFLAPQSVQERIDYTFQDEKIVDWQQEIGNLTLDTSSSARLHDWWGALRAFVEKPIFGYGITGWKFVDNQYIRTLVELGVVGVVTFIGLMYTLLRVVWSIHETVRTPLAKGLSVGLFAGTIALLTHAIGTNTFIIVRIMEPYWFIVGLVLALPMLEQRQMFEPANGRAEIVGA